MIFNLGSINADYFYTVPHLPEAGETIAATAFETGLGGKGANMSVAIARAGGSVHHIGAVGKDGDWAVDYLRTAGVDVSNVAKTDAPTGHAIIYRDEAGENTIVICPGANELQDKGRISSALSCAKSGDILLVQNETSLQRFAAEIGVNAGMTVAYAAAPFDVVSLQEILPYMHILFLNQIEMAQLLEATGLAPETLGLDLLIVTKGKDGCAMYSKELGEIHFPPIQVSPIDTTGAGDTFTGYFLANLDQGHSVESAVLYANAAGALMVTRKGTAEAIPLASEVDQFLV